MNPPSGDCVVPPFANAHYLFKDTTLVGTTAIQSAILNQKLEIEFGTGVDKS